MPSLPPRVRDRVFEWIENFTDDDVPVFKAAGELTKLYEGAGVTREKDVHFY